MSNDIPLFAGVTRDEPDSRGRVARNRRIQFCTLLYASEENGTVVMADLLDGTGCCSLAVLADHCSCDDYSAFPFRLERRTTGRHGAVVSFLL
jgi:hypothetical protein